MNDVVQDREIDDRVLRVERRIAAPPERVFDYFSDPDLFVKWWAPEGYALPEHSLDVRPGGRWRTTMQSPDGKLHTVSGVYRVIDKPNRLVFTWAWHDGETRGHETEVTVTFDPAPGGTRLTILHQAFETAQSRAQHVPGWESCLNNLERVLAAAP